MFCTCMRTRRMLSSQISGLWRSWPKKYAKDIRHFMTHCLKALDWNEGLLRHLLCNRLTSDPPPPQPHSFFTDLCLFFYPSFYSCHKQSGPLYLHRGSEASANLLVGLCCFLAVCRSVAWVRLSTLPPLAVFFILYRSDLWPISSSSLTKTVERNPWK